MKICYIHFMGTDWYNARKAAQVAAFFCIKEGGDSNVLKLTKLIYIADRSHIDKYGYPIIDDEYVSMPHGPVNSLTLNHIDGNVDSAGWAEFISDRQDYMVCAKNIAEDQLDELSDAEIETLTETWIKFEKFSKYEIRDWTHEHCPEWEDPNGSATPIPFERILKYLCNDHVEEYTALKNKLRQVSMA